MRFKIDENLPVEVAQRLVAASHDAPTILDQNMSGRPDQDVATICRTEQRALITLDTDFGDIRAYPPDQYFGLLVLRPARQDKATILSLIERIMPLFQSEPLEKHLWIVDESSVRIRGTS
jgi:predicted nuclease of predicted toxin-antitoxin system